MKLELESRQIDSKRRLILPGCPPGAAVTVQTIDQDTWLVKRHRPAKGMVKVVLVPVVDKLPRDPAWEKVEEAFATGAAKGLPEPEP